MHSHLVFSFSLGLLNRGRLGSATHICPNMGVQETDMFCRNVCHAHVCSLCIISHFFTHLKRCSTTAGEFSGKMGLADSRVQCLVWVLWNNDGREITFVR